MKLYSLIFSFLFLFNNLAFSQELIVIKGVVKNLPDSIKFINLSTDSGYHYMKLNHGKFDFMW